MELFDCTTRLWENPLVPQVNHLKSRPPLFTWKDRRGGAPGHARALRLPRHPKPERPMGFLALRTSRGGGPLPAGRRVRLCIIYIALHLSAVHTVHTAASPATSAKSGSARCATSRPTPATSPSPSASPTRKSDGTEKCQIALAVLKIRIIFKKNPY